MKCSYCGNNLNIDDESCSYCGKKNIHGIQHRKDMQHFRDDYNTTKGIVFEKSGKTVSIMAKGTIILVLIVICILILVATKNTYQIRTWVNRLEVHANIDRHKKNLNRLEEDRDFFGLASYYEQNDLYLSTELQEYRTVVNISSSYVSVYKHTFELLNNERYPYTSIERILEYIGDNIVWCYRYFEYNEYRPEEYSETHMAAMEDLRYELETFIHVYLKVPKEDIEKFSELSSAKIQLIIEGSGAYVED